MEIEAQFKKIGKLRSYLPIWNFGRDDLIRVALGEIGKAIGYLHEESLQLLKGSPSSIGIATVGGGAGEDRKVEDRQFKSPNLLCQLYFDFIFLLFFKKF